MSVEPVRVIENGAFNMLPDHHAQSLTFRLNVHAIHVEGDWCERTAATDVTLSMHTYRVTARDGAPRPVLFFFNGGPGASSTPLHFQGFGPRLYAGSDDEDHRFVDNPDTLLGVADLVFVDPIGTGFNRQPADGEAGNPAERWLSPEGDARVCAAAIRAWVMRFGRDGTPVFLCGQSYGGFRVALMLPYLDDLNVTGVVLISPALDMSARANVHGNDRAYLYTFPTMAVAAQHHQITQPVMSPMAVYETTAFIARERYATALQWGNELDPARARAMATELSQWIGMPVQSILDRQLRVNAETYMREILAPLPLRIGSLDVRETGSLDAVAGRPTNDPSLVVSRSSGRTEGYFRQFFGHEAERPYVGLSFDVNGRWNWYAEDPLRRLYRSATGDLAESMQRRPHMRLLAACGIYDMSTPALATRHALGQCGIPAERVCILDFPGGHTVYDRSDNRASLSRAIRDLIVNG